MWSSSTESMPASNANAASRSATVQSSRKALPFDRHIDDQARMRACAFGLEHEGVHGLALDIESFWMVHQEPPSVA